MSDRVNWRRLASARDDEDMEERPFRKTGHPARKRKTEQEDADDPEDW